MKSDIVFSLKGYQDIAGEDAVAETVSEGRYFKKGGRHFILYNESGSPEDRSGMIKISDGHVDVTRKGSESVHMIFIQGEDTKAVYNTDAGNLNMNIFTESVSVIESEDEIITEIEYALTMNEVFISKSRVVISIRSRQ